MRKGKIKLKIKPILKVFFIGLIVAFILVFSISNYIKAGSGDNVSGWAWNDVLGWISFNCTDDSCIPIDYGVNVEANGNLTGYAWSEAVGYIWFNPDGPFPGLPNYSAQKNLGDGKVSGWARICSMADDPGSCSGGTVAGWIKMRKDPADAGGDYGVYVDRCYQFRDFAWSDDFGWISFNCLDDPGGCGFSYGVIESTYSDVCPNSPNLQIDGHMLCEGETDDITYTVPVDFTGRRQSVINNCALRYFIPTRTKTPEWESFIRACPRPDGVECVSLDPYYNILACPDSVTAPTCSGSVHRMTINWSFNTQPVLGYPALQQGLMFVEFDNNADFSSPEAVIDQLTIGSADTFATLDVPGLTNSTLYYWRINILATREGANPNWAWTRWSVAPHLSFTTNNCP